MASTTKSGTRRDPEERARLLQAIEEGYEDFERGDHMDAFEFVAQLRAKPEAPDR